MRDSIPSTLLGAVFAGFVLTGCKPSDPSSAHAQQVPAAVAATHVAQATGATCAALTAAKASAVLDSTVTLDVSVGDGDGRSTCTYTYSQGAKVRAYVVVGSDAKQQYEAMKSGVTDPTDVSGVGDEAFDSGQGFGAIQGDHFVTVIGQTPGDESGKQKLAQAMLAAL